ADQFHGLLTAEALQRLELLADRRREAGHIQIAPSPELRGIDRRRVDQKPDRRPWARMPVPHFLAYGEHRFLARQRLAQDVGEEVRRRLVRLARADAYGRQAD